MTPATTSSSKCSRKALLGLLVWVAVMIMFINYNQEAMTVAVQDMFKEKMVVRVTIRPEHYTLTPIDNCKGFSDNPFDPTVAKFFHIKPTISCSKGVPSIMYIDKSEKKPEQDINGVKNNNVTTSVSPKTVYTLTLNEVKIKKLGVKFDSCRYAVLSRRNGVDDFQTSQLVWSKPFTKSIVIPDKVDHLLGECLLHNKIQSQDYISIIRKRPEVEATLLKNFKSHVQRVKPLETLSIMLIGIDGTSKNNFARQMKSTKTFLLDKMGAFELLKLNKIGLNTLPNVLPLLTGHSETEIRKNWTDKEFLDKIDHMFLWEEARKAGYRTNVVFDKTKITSFHFLKKGWKNPKFHFYNRPLVVHSEFNRLARNKNRYCVGDQSEMSLFLDYFVQMAQVYNNSKETPYFAYSFFAHLTHDIINLASSADKHYLGVLQKLHDQRLLNNTLLIFFSDHGSRYGPFRSTFKGMLEDSNPFMFFVFPPWFKAKYPHLMDNFRVNQHRMISNFDIVVTFVISTLKLCDSCHNVIMTTRRLVTGH